MMYSVGPVLPPFLGIEAVSKAVDSKLVVEFLLLLVSQDGIGRRDLLELFLCRLVSLVVVRMELPRQLPVGLFDLGLAGPSFDPEHSVQIFVVHFLHHMGTICTSHAF